MVSPLVDLRPNTRGCRKAAIRLGWTIGAGAEFALTPNWSVKAEYLYMGFASRTYTFAGTDYGFDSNLIRFGFNYRF